MTNFLYTIFTRSKSYCDDKWFLIFPLYMDIFVQIYYSNVSIPFISFVLLFMVLLQININYLVRNHFTWDLHTIILLENLHCFFGQKFQFWLQIRNQQNSWMLLHCILGKNKNAHFSYITKQMCIHIYIFGIGQNAKGLWHIPLYTHIICVRVFGWQLLITLLWLLLIKYFKYCEIFRI